MRRGIVLLSLGWGILWIMFINQFLQERKTNIPSWEQSTISADIGVVSFPCEISGTNLHVEGIGMYEGPFLEDMSGTPVADVAALRIINRSDYPVERGAVILEMDGERYVFEIYAIPPGGSVFVCESERKKFTSKPVTACMGWAVEDVWPDTQALLTIVETGLDTLEITNLTDRMLPCVQMLYKSYDKESGVYIGGVCHALDIPSLEPGESRTVVPYRYARGYSHVVAVKLTE